MLNDTLFNSQTELVSYTRLVWRMVETQETAATLQIVDTMQEQARLEELLDEVKPPYRAGTEGMHYLLKTAFRYPPLKYGSRFGTRAMASFFYASEKPHTTLAETAYYRFVFLDDMQTPYGDVIDSQHCLFNVRAKTDHCLDLLSEFFGAVREQLISPSSYAITQAVGMWVTNERQATIIRFESARDIGAPNLAIAEPSVIQSKAPLEKQSWLCRTRPDRISFSSREVDFPQLFNKQEFMVDGQLPRVI